MRLDIVNHLTSLSLCADSFLKLGTVTDVASSVDFCSVIVELRDLAVAFRQLSVNHSTTQTSLENTGPRSPEQDAGRGMHPQATPHPLGFDGDLLSPSKSCASLSDTHPSHEIANFFNVKF